MKRFYKSKVVVVVVASLFNHGITFTYSGLPVSRGYKNILHEFLLYAIYHLKSQL